MTDGSWTRFESLRKELFAAIGESLEEDGHCKSYEGHFRIEASLPNYFEEKDKYPALWSLVLNCYVVGPHRHYVWEGNSFDECLRKAEIDIRAWIAGDDESRHFKF